MKKLDIGQTVGVLANIGVIAGIIFLAVELQQNNQLLAAQTRTTRMEVRKESTNRYLENPELVRLLFKRRHDEPLTEEENFLLEGIMFTLLVTFEYTFTESQEGLIEGEVIPVAGWRSIFHGQYPDMPGYWESAKRNFRQDFVDWMEENVVNER